PGRPAEPSGALEDGAPRARAVQLVGPRQTRRPRPDDRDAFTGAYLWRMGDDPALVKCSLDDGGFRRLDRHRIVVDAEDARALARRRTQASGELRKIVGGVQPIERCVPAIAIDKIVPVRNQVAERAPLVAERNAAIHASRGLLRDLGLRVRQVHLAPVAGALLHGTRRPLRAPDLP